NLKAEVYDINRASLDADYGFISCTVTLMFLDPARVDAVIADMQAHTLAGGYNLIVCAMNTQAYPCPVNFPFTLNEGQLRDMYQGWELIKRSEEHTSELQSRENLVCRLLLEKKKTTTAK